MTVPRQARKKDPRARQRARTRSAIIAAAHEVATERGEVPSIAEAAEAADVGRTTAYRYFPTQGDLLWALVQDVVPTADDIALTSDDPVERVDQLVLQAFDATRVAEPHMRAQVRLAMEQWAQRRSGTLADEPIPRGGRRPVIDLALQPLEGNMDPVRLRRLKATLAAVGAIEARIVYVDIYGMGEREAMETARWAARAAIRQALAEEAAER